MLGGEPALEGGFPVVELCLCSRDFNRQVQVMRSQAKTTVKLLQLQIFSGGGGT
ncbi:MAG: hypothetical protein ACHBN1_12270 [Heteroscytonema crispum UTEX LB 1556]